MNWGLHSEQKFIGSFDLPWSKWSGISDPSKSLSSQRSTHPKWHRFLPKQFIGQTPLHHIHKFSFHWNLVIHKQPATVRNPISYKHDLPQVSRRYLECMGQASGMQLWNLDSLVLGGTCIKKFETDPWHKFCLDSSWMISCYLEVTNFLYHLCKEKCRCGYLLGGQFNESGGVFLLHL